MKQQNNIITKHSNKTNMKKIKNYLQLCKECGSKEVARCKWVNVNTEEIYSNDSGTTLEWCFNCKNETDIIEEDDYINSLNKQEK